MVSGKEQSNTREKNSHFRWKDADQSMCQEFSESQDIGSRIDEGNISFFLRNGVVRRGG